MKIAIVTAAYPFGSGEAFIGPEIEQLVRLGHQVTVVPRQASGRINALPTGLGDEVRLAVVMPLGFAALGAALARFLRQPLRVLRTVKALFGSGLKCGLKNLWVLPKAAWLSRWLRQNNIDHVHAHWAGTSGTMAMVACEWAGVPWSITCHQWDIYADNLLVRKVRSARFSRFISRRGLQAAMALGADPGRAEIIHMGIGNIAGSPSAQWTGSERVFRIAVPANLLDVKGHRYLIQALRLLKDRGLAVELTLFGDGPLKGPLEEQAQLLEVRDQVVFSGHVAHDRLLGHYAAGDFHLVCVPSIVTDEGEFEGIPVSLMEAMGAGVPVVSTLTGSIPELVPEDSGLLVPDRDPEALADAIGRLVRDPDWYRQCSQACLDIISRGWSSAGAIEALLSRIDPQAVVPAGR